MRDDADMRGGARRVTVEVPATSANLGVGFDVLGLALDLRARFAFEPAETLVVEGVPAALKGPGNLVWTSYLAGCEEFGFASRPLRITEDSPIPASGGLGSSSACVVAGIAAAQALAGVPLDRRRTLSLATRIEGHPDNVAPAVMGGLVSSYVDGEETVTCRWQVAPGLSFVLVAPPYRVLTRDARQALPSMVARDAVSWQVGRCLAMVSALASGDAAAISHCCHDRIHEPYRAPLIPDFEPLRTACLAAGAATFVISGSGAAMLAVCTNERVAARVAEAARAARENLWIRTLHASEQGTTITYR